LKKTGHDTGATERIADFEQFSFLQEHLASLNIYGASSSSLAVEASRKIRIGYGIDVFSILGELYFESITVIGYRRAPGHVIGTKMPLPDPGYLLGLDEKRCDERKQKKKSAHSLQFPPGKLPK
jgi:hypothetical protein